MFNNENNKEKHKRKTVRSSFPLLLLRALLIALLIFCGYKLLTSSQWYYSQSMFNSVKNKNFIIVGTYITSKDKVLDVMKKVQIPRRPLYMLDVKAFEDRISEIETVKSVFVRRYWFPARMQIVIEDKMPILMVAPDEKSEPIAFFVEDGTLLSSDLLPKNEKIYPLKVITNGKNSNDNFVNWKQDRLNQLTELAEKVSLFSGEDVEYIDIRDANNTYIKIQSVLINLGEMNDTAYSRLKSIASILPNLDKIDEKIKYIDLRWDVVKYVTVEDKKNDNIVNSVQPEDR